VSESFEIRLARTDEYDEIGEITVRGYERDGFLSASEDYASSLRDATSRAVGAELWVAVELATDRVLGSVTFCPLGSPYRELATDTEGEFRMLAVDPAARGLGVGRALVQHCLDHSREMGFGAVVICSLPAMTTAHGLYSSLGFSREPSLDWTPVPGVDLWGFRARLVPENRV
jgi:ribosomal protein S18 acetylase RimI-like enzyme